MSNESKTTKWRLPLWRKSRFGENLEYVQRRPGGGRAVWLGTVEPEIQGICHYRMPHQSGSCASQEMAKKIVEAGGLENVK